ncbi:MAG: RecX family transcriptional regulator [candidate division Zixibacteria bacterium]|nr:RecX family transcriptional regulator [candidate division Zixibacteria bacterium]
MPKITALEKQRRRPGRVSVFVDGSFAVGLSAASARELGLAVGRDLDEGELRALASAHEADRAYERATRYLRARPRSRREVERRLARHGYGDDVIRHVLERLAERGFVDDREFAGAWVRDRARLKPKGRRALAAELRAKGVAREEVEAALEDNLGETEEELARRALAPRLAAMRAQAEGKGRAAALSFLTRRGFDAALARRLAEEAFSS